MQKIQYGHKYVQDADLKDIAKEVRKDIRHAVEAGKLPDTKYSVTIQKYSGGQSLRIGATHKDFGPFGSPRLQAYIRFVTRLTDEYNFDGSDSMSDHFHVNFYTHVVLRNQET